MSGHFATTHSWSGPSRNSSLPDPAHFAHLVNRETLHEFEQERRHNVSVDGASSAREKPSIQVSEWSLPEKKKKKTTTHCELILPCFGVPRR